MGDESDVDDDIGEHEDEGRTIDELDDDEDEDEDDNNDDEVEDAPTPPVEPFPYWLDVIADAIIIFNFIYALSFSCFFFYLNFYLSIFFSGF